MGISMMGILLIAIGIVDTDFNRGVCITCMCACWCGHATGRSSLFLDMLDTFAPEDVYCLIHRLPHSQENCSNDITSNSGSSSGSSHVVMEFPLLDKSRLHVPELEYLAHVLQASRPSLHATVTLTSSHIAQSNSFFSKPSLHFSKLPYLPNLRHVPLPSWDGSSTTLFDFLPAVEQSIADTWGRRKRFVSELQQIAAVVEFDPVDFSFVSLSLRLTRNKHFILSIVDLRIPALFPSAPILLQIHDLLSGSSYPLENKSTLSNAAFLASEWTPERMAREYFLQLCAEIESMAFGGKKSIIDGNTSSNNKNTGSVY